jgi:hypothetical protein
MGFEDFIAVRVQTTIFWIVKLRCLVHGYRHFEGTYACALKVIDGDSMLLWNIGNHLQDYAVSQHIRPQSEK